MTLVTVMQAQLLEYFTRGFIYTDFSGAGFEDQEVPFELRTRTDWSQGDSNWV